MLRSYSKMGYAIVTKSDKTVGGVFHIKRYSQEVTVGGSMKM